MEIYAEIISHSEQRYPTVGDWKKNKSGSFLLFDYLNIKVSQMGNEDYEFLVTIHEIIEAYLCLKRGIKEEEVTKFDTQFKGKGEAGDDKRAPYRKEHQFATKIEKLLAKELKVDWQKYESVINSL